MYNHKSHFQHFKFCLLLFLLFFFCFLFLLENLRFYTLFEKGRLQLAIPLFSLTKERILENSFFVFLSYYILIEVHPYPSNDSILILIFVNPVFFKLFKRSFRRCSQLCPPFKLKLRKSNYEDTLDPQHCTVHFFVVSNYAKGLENRYIIYDIIIYST